jgi:hypothetical protein
MKAKRSSSPGRFWILGTFAILGTGMLLERVALAQPSPPPAAFEACEGHDEGDACEVRFDGQRIAGQCVAMNERLICRPNNFPF